jgi:glycerol-3-phosphate dehydrogenase
VALASTYDAIVVGGGLTGAGTARDLALRGLSVLLLEKGDWGGGGSTWMLHGGPRSVEVDWDTARLAREEGAHIVAIAPHLVRRCAMLVPILPDERLPSLTGSLPHMRVAGGEARRLEPGLSPHVTEALVLDEWSVDPHRLAWANVLDAGRAGATAHNHTRVETLLRDGARVTGVRYRAPDGSRGEARARMVVNACGPWARQVAALAGADVPLRLARAVHVVYDRQLSGLAISAEAVDGGEVVLLPHGGATLLGSAEADHYGDPDAPEVAPDDVDYLVQAAERVFPSIREHRPARAAASVRAALFQWRTPAGDLSRRFEVVDHERRDGVPGLVTVAGGTLPLFRLVAERAADVVCARLGVRTAGTTAARPLPGAGGAVPPARELARDHGIPALAAARLLGRHGSEAAEVLQDPRRGRLVCRCEALTEAELVHAARQEQVRTLADAFRRVGLAAGPCAGTACVERAAEVLGHELGWSASQRRDACRDYQAVAWPGRAPVLDRWGWAQEELAYGLRRGWPGGL